MCASKPKIPDPPPTPAPIIQPPAPVKQATPTTPAQKRRTGDPQRSTGFTALTIQRPTTGASLSSSGSGVQI